MLDRYVQVPQLSLRRCTSQAVHPPRALRNILYSVFTADLERMQDCRYTVCDLALLVPAHSEHDELDYVGVELCDCFFHALGQVQDCRQIRSGQYVSDAGQSFRNLREEFFVIQKALRVRLDHILNAQALHECQDFVRHVEYY
jgi:hypothetical protein